MDKKFYIHIRNNIKNNNIVSCKLFEIRGLNSDYYNPFGGITVCWQYNKNNGIDFTYVRCSKKDRYVKAIGREITERKFKDQKNVFHITNRQIYSRIYCGAFASEYKDNSFFNSSFSRCVIDCQNKCQPDVKTFSYISIEYCIYSYMQDLGVTFDGKNHKRQHS